MSRNVVVIGAGIVGASAALELARDGHRVTIIDLGPPGGEQAASFGNGAWISPASIVPMSMPGLWRKVPGYLLDPTGPFTIRAASLPALLPWLLRFVAAGATPARVRRTAAALCALLADAPARHAALAEEAACPSLMRAEGLLYAYPDRAAFEAEALGWTLRRENGLAWEELDTAALHRREPALAPRYTFGVLVPAGAHCVDPGAFVAALVARAEALGATRLARAATGFDVQEGRLRAVLTAEGAVPCERAILAAGIGSGPLARRAGARVPLAAERGYHVVVPAGDAGPRIPVMPSDGKMANTPTRAGLRAAGQVELAAPDAPPDWRRAEILLGHLRSTWPGLGAARSEDGNLPPRHAEEAQHAPSRSTQDGGACFETRPMGAPQHDEGEKVGTIRRWMGCRPSTPDGLPAIGPTRSCPDILYAFGHGHIGLAAGPMTGRLVADLVGGREPTIPLAPFDPARFRWARL